MSNKRIQLKNTREIVYYFNEKFIKKTEIVNKEPSANLGVEYCNRENKKYSLES
jgi:hypothetical protein